MEIEYELALQILISFIVGSLIGFEREYRSKAAGLRTMIMICIGSTIFTQISLSIGGNSTDRIASNIITGIGFLGAGVIFKDGLSINGITTATTIWISAALGMAVGSGEYFIALLGCLIVLIVLSFFENVQHLIMRLHQTRAYRITFAGDKNFPETFEDMVKKMRLRAHKTKDIKGDTDFTVLYEVNGRERRLESLNDFLKSSPHVKSFEY